MRHRVFAELPEELFLQSAVSEPTLAPTSRTRSRTDSAEPRTSRAKTGVNTITGVGLAVASAGAQR